MLKRFNMQFSPASCYFLPFMPKSLPHSRISLDFLLPWMYKIKHCAGQLPEGIPTKRNDACPKRGRELTVLNAVIFLRFSDCKEKTPSRKARDPEAAKKLWDLSVKLVGLGDWNPFTADDSTPPSWTAHDDRN
jgi:hypothetical protein